MSKRTEVHSYNEGEKNDVKVWAKAEWDNKDFLFD